MIKKHYKYLIKVKDIKSLADKIRYVTQPPGPKTWAKAKVMNLFTRITSGKLKPDNDGNVLISASEGDTIKSANFNIKLELVKENKVQDQDLQDYWWNNM